MRWVLAFLCAIVISQSEKVYENLYGTKPFDNKLLNATRAPLTFDEFKADLLKHDYRKITDRTPHDGDQFDFIVVGAGTAGATIASRLTEILEIKVLLIEAGGDEDIVMDVPVLTHHLQANSKVHWQFQSEPSKNYCTGLTGNRCTWPVGKVLGGSSVMHYMIATRGFTKDYDDWAELGNEGWSWKDVLPYFKKLESFNVLGYEKNPEIHNYDGPVFINYTRFQTPLAQAFLEAGNELGYKTNIDYNSGSESIGFSYIHTTIKNGQRQSSNVAYLLPVKSRKNLIVTKNSLVSRILFDANNKKAIGVEYIKGKKKYRVFARKEVILSAGALNSPKILMLSGIGHTEHLKKENVVPILDLPVGDNFIDHIAYGGLMFTVNQPVSLIEKDLLSPQNPYLRDYSVYRSGPFTIPGGSEVLAYLDVDEPNNQDTIPNIELLFASFSLGAIKSASDVFGISDEVWNKTYSKLEDTYTFTIFPILLTPKSRGHVRLRDNNVYSKPKFFAQYMEDKEDVRLLIAGIRAALRVGESKAMRKFGAKLFKAHYSQCEGITEGTDDFWECVTRTIPWSFEHFAGTCKMGPKNDSTAVVDPQLRVRGIEGLRVADASIMPVAPRAHLNIPTFMIGEKISDMLKKDWGY